MITCGFMSSIEALNAGLFVSPGYGTHATRVIDSYELIFVTRGRLDMFEEEMSYHLEANQALLLYPFKKHGGLLPYTPEVNFYWVHFRLSESRLEGETIRIPKLSTVRDPEFLTEIFCRFISDQESSTLSQLTAGHLVALMLCEVSESAKTHPNEAGFPAGPSQQASLARQVHAYIEGNFRSQVTTSSVARDLRYNADYLERIYRRYCGTSILDALHRKRISAARSLLRTEGRKNINEVAFTCGYTDPGYFRRVFKRLTGLTPRQFRSLYSRTHINTH